MRSSEPVHLSDRLACPRCGRLAFEARPRSGDLTLDCERKRCRTSWWAIVLPPGATGAYLRHLFSARVAEAILRRLFPGLADGLIWEMPLAPASHRRYLQVRIDGPTKHRSLYLDNDGMAAVLGLAP